MGLLVLVMALWPDRLADALVAILGSEVTSVQYNCWAHSYTA